MTPRDKAPRGDGRGAGRPVPLLGGAWPEGAQLGVPCPRHPPAPLPSARLDKDTTDASASVSSLTSSSWSSPRRPWPAQTASSGWLGTKRPVSRQSPGPGQAGGGLLQGQLRPLRARAGPAACSGDLGAPPGPAGTDSHASGLSLWPPPRLPPSTSRAGSGMSMTNPRLSLKWGLRAWQPHSRMAVSVGTEGDVKACPGWRDSTGRGH